MPFPRLFSPIQIGSMTLRNRIVLPAHDSPFMPGYGDIMERVAAYQVERAKGGAGLIVMSNFVVPDHWRELASWGGRLQTSALGALNNVSDRALIPHYRRVIDGVHRHGAKFLSQLNAGGRQAYGPGGINFGLPLAAPSALPDPKLRQLPREMEAAEIEAYVAAYGQAAVNVREAGADGVEVFAAQGYLLHQFLSPGSNHRTDRYGGGLENRMRFLVEAIGAVRKAAGRDFVVGVRMNGADFAPDGVDLAMAQEIAGALAATGMVDYLNVSGMTNLRFPAWIAGMTAPQAMFADLAAGVRRAAAGLPVCVVSRVESPEAAEALIAEGKADMVGMVRALISDPELPNKARAGDVADIRGCTYCNHCLMSFQAGRGLACLHNVAVGREAQLGIGTGRPAAQPRRVVVVGGGPAGMAAARIAAERGHSVVLLEKADRLGGQNAMTASMAAREKLGEVTRWQEHRLRRHQVEVRLGAEATREDVLRLRPDAVVVATGSRPRRSGYSSFRPDVASVPGVEREEVLTVWDVFQRPDAVGRRVVLVDDDPHLSGAYVAEHLAAKGHEVRIVTPQLYPARDLEISFVPELYAQLAAKGVRTLTGVLLAEVRDGSVVLLDRYGGGETVLEGVDSVVLATGNEAEDGLYHALKDGVADLQLVGDGLAPRRIEDAVLDGERAGWMIR